MTSKSLEPFAFFIKSSPVAYSGSYYDVSDWLESVVNEDEGSGDLPPPANLFSDVPDRYRGRCAAVIDALGRCSGRGAHDAAVLAAWRKLCVVDRIVSLSDPETWKKSNQRFAPLQRRVWWVRKANRWFDRPCDSHEGYVKIGAAALVLELFYRFVWARHTMKEIRKASEAAPASASATTTTTTTTEETLGDDDVIDVKELGEGAEDDAEAEEEEEGETGEHEDAEEEIGDESQDEGTAKRPRSPEVEELAPAASTPQDTVGDETKAEIESEEIELDDGDEEEGSPGDVPIPARTALFFVHEAIVSAIDEVEGEFLERSEPDGPFDTTKVFSVFAKLVCSRDKNRGVKPKATSQVMEEIISFYHRKFVWFIRKLGIEATGNPFKSTWSWNCPSVGTARFIDSMHVATFRNLTNDGEGVNTAAMSRLFPKLSFIQDSRIDTRLPDLCASLTFLLASKGMFSAEADRVVSTLNTLVDERKAIVACIAREEEEQQGSAMAVVSESRARRLAEIDSLIERLRDEFHRLTGSVDSIQPRKKPRSDSESIDPAPPASAPAPPAPVAPQQPATVAQQDALVDPLVGQLEKTKL